MAGGRGRVIAGVEFGGQTRDPFVATDGRVWFVAQRGNYLGVFDPTTERFTRYEKRNPGRAAALRGLAAAGSH